MTWSEDSFLKVFGGAVVLLVFLVGGCLAIRQDRHERELLAGGTCTAIMEALYTPPPTAITSCFGSDPPICTTSMHQSDPYLRTLWRCRDPDRGGASVEFWRRSTERGR